MIFILGMHRSGTSALTSILNIAGLELGENLFPANFCNPKGFFEDNEAKDINDNFLFLSNSAWYKTEKLKLKKTRLVAFTKKRIKAFLQDRFQNREMFGLKDPRLCRTLPLWQEVLSEMDIQPLYVMVVRNPLEVAKSLEKRNNLDEKISLDAWFQHTLEAERYTRSGNRIVISYDETLNNPINVIKKVSKKFEIRLDSSKKTEEKLDDFLDIKLRHSAFSLEDLKNNPSVSKDIFELYKAMSKGKYLKQLPEIPQMKIIEKTDMKAIEEVIKKTEIQIKKYTDEIKNQFAEIEQRQVYEKRKKSISFLVIKILSIFIPSKKLRKKLRSLVK
ncbi:MAG: sulfotransferase family protein [Alphaproteobacteria bacterium]